MVNDASSLRVGDLRRHWNELLPRLQESRGVCLLSDYDGTLTPLVDRPEDATLDAEMSRILGALARNPRVVFGVVSGRSLEDLRSRVGLPGIWYVGNHGYEIVSPEGRERRFYEKDEASFLAGVADELARATSPFPGVLVENKGPVVAVHYRRVAAESVSDVEKAFLSVVDRHHRRIMIARGWCVLEARLRSGCNKGMAVRFIRQELPAGTFMLYFGDDLTDRDAFRTLRRWGVSVAVGPDEGLAEYTLPDPGAVRESLGRIEEILRPPRERPSRRGPRSSRRKGR